MEINKAMPLSLTALRLSKFFGNSAEFWMNLQNRYELEVARDNLFSTIDKEVELYPAILDDINHGDYLGYFVMLF